ncbi:MAG: SAM-dependent methyltransferase, partial [Burkholderiaceae bacterium]
MSTVAARSKAPSPRHAAIAYCQGTPLRGEIETRDQTRLGEVTEIVERALAERFGSGAVDAAIQAHVFIVER